MSDELARAGGRLAGGYHDSLAPTMRRTGWRSPWSSRLALVASWPGIAMLGVAGLAIGLRYWGIYWGAPERINMHPDEMNHLISHTLRVMNNVSAVLRGTAPLTIYTLDPVFLNYPSFLMYLTAGGYALVHAIGLVGEGTWQVHVVGRMISAAFGAATPLVAFLIARELGAPARGAILAGLWMALMPLHVWESHVAVTDVMMTFWVAVTLWAALRLIRSGHWRDYVLAGAALGFATGSKYTALLACVPIVVAALSSRRPLGKTMRGLAVCALVSAVCCFVVAPYSFIRFRDFLAAMSYEYAHAHGHQLGFSLPAAGPQYRHYVYQLVAAWPFSLGFALYASAAIGTVWALSRLDSRRLSLFSFVAIFFAVTGSWTFTPLRYYMPILLVAVIFAGLWHDAWLASPLRWRRYAATVAVAVTLIYTAVFTFQTTARYGSDTRIEAGQWLARGLPPGTRLLMVGPRSYVAFPPDETRYRIHFLDYRLVPGLSWRTRADAIEITSLMYERAYRHDLKGHVRAYEKLRHPDSHFQMVKRFESTFIHKRLYTALDPMFEGYFLSPTIEVYARRPKSRQSDGANP